MKKQVLFVSAVVLSLTFASCGSKTEEAKTPEEVAEQVEEQVEEAVEEVKEEAADAVEEVKEEAAAAKATVKDKVKKEVKETAAEVKKEIETTAIEKGNVKVKTNAKAVEEVKQIEIQAAPISSPRK